MAIALDRVVFKDEDLRERRDAPGKEIQGRMGGVHVNAKTQTCSSKFVGYAFQRNAAKAQRRRFWEGFALMDAWLYNLDSQ